MSSVDLETVFGPVPRDTEDRAMRVLSSANAYLTVGDNLGSLFTGVPLPRPPGARDGPLAPEQLLLLSAFQCAEGLTDDEATRALGARVDLKYALHLPFDQPPPPSTSLVELREALRSQPALCTPAQHVLRGLVLLGFPWPPSLQTATVARLLDEVGQINALALNAVTLWLALEALSERHGAWLWDEVLPGRWAWYADRELPARVPTTPGARAALARELGEDGRRVLAAVHQLDAPSDLILPAELDLLSSVWRWQYRVDEDGLCWRLAGSSPTGERPRPAAH